MSDILTSDEQPRNNQLKRGKKMKKKVSVRVIISGRVQGVFFRMETKKEADKLGIFGWVRNRNDGTVEAVFEGDEDRVTPMIEWCRKGPPLSNVSGIDIQRGAWQNEFERFEITY
jgi:acylphosphatase